MGQSAGPTQTSRARMIRDFFPRRGLPRRADDHHSQKSGLLEQMISLRQTSGQGSGPGIDEMTTLFEKFAVNQRTCTRSEATSASITPADDALLQTMRQRIEVTQFWHDTLKPPRSWPRSTRSPRTWWRQRSRRDFTGLQSAISASPLPSRLSTTR